MPSPKTTSTQMTPFKVSSRVRYLREYLPRLLLALVGIELGWGFGAKISGSAGVLGTQVFHAGDVESGFFTPGVGWVC
ncbi:MAG: hypothetical protein U0670_17025 [Anaerolineae bacterium]